MLPSAQHTACTIEMTNLSRRVDVAIIDEIQVMSLHARPLCQWSAKSRSSTGSWTSVYRALRALFTAQQIGEPQRGWAWTRALQGVPANEIHLCGDGSALPLIKRLAADMNEPLKVALVVCSIVLPHACYEQQQKEACMQLGRHQRVPVIVQS